MTDEFLNYAMMADSEEFDERVSELGMVGTCIHILFVALISLLRRDFTCFGRYLHKCDR